MGIVYKQENLPKECYKIFEDMRLRKEFCDVTINVGSHSIYAHQVILAVSIPHFRSSFGSRIESGQSDISLSDVNPIALESLIDYAYRCEVEISNENAEMLLSAACFLQVDFVRKACVEFLISGFTVKHALNLRVLGDRVGCLDLVNKVDDYVKENFDGISRCEGFLDLPYSYVKDLISRDDLHVDSEEKVFEALMRWVKKVPDERCLELPNLLSCVRMPFLQLHYLRENVATEELVRGSLQCRDILDDARDYHLFQDKSCNARNAWKFSLVPRRYRKKVDLDATVSVFKKQIPSDYSVLERHAYTEETLVPNAGISEVQESKVKPQCRSDSIQSWTSSIEKTALPVNVQPKQLKNFLKENGKGIAAVARMSDTVVVGEQKIFQKDGQFCRSGKMPLLGTGELETDATKFRYQPKPGRYFETDAIQFGYQPKPDRNYLETDATQFGYQPKPDRYYLETEATKFNEPRPCLDIFNDKRALPAQDPVMPYFQFSQYSHREPVFPYTPFDELWRVGSRQELVQRHASSAQQRGYCPTRGGCLMPEDYNIPLRYVKYHPSIDSSANKHLIKKCELKAWLC